MVSLVAIAAGFIAMQDLKIAPYPELSTAEKFKGDYLVDRVTTDAKLYRGPGNKEITLDNGLVRRTFRFDPNAATVSLMNLQSGESFLRSVKPEATLTINGNHYNIGGLTGQPNHAFLKPEWLDSMSADPHAFRLVRVSTGTCNKPFDYKVTRHSESRPWPPRGIQLTMVYTHNDFSGLLVEVRHELYDGIPVFMKRLVVRNNSGYAVRIDKIAVEALGVVEFASEVEGVTPTQGNLEAISDYSFGGMDHRTSDKATQWVEDPDYVTQVNYQKKTPCLLLSSPKTGPGFIIPPGQRLESHRSFLLLHDSSNKERRGLTTRRFYRTLAPWITENPLMFHLTTTDPEAVKLGIDQAKESGFEMVILSFGSGLNMEDVSEENLKKLASLRNYAQEQGIELGGYSLLASRSIDDDNDVINPQTGKTGNAIFGNSPCLGSRWGQNYFESLSTFFARTKFDILEHDGSYPGDLCASSTHPGHQGLADSQWTQWKSITGLYERMRARGTFLNVPDWYVLSGSNKTGMGYRETNWSLPREQQHIHARQNMFDGTWLKPPTAGWMFVPLSEYHGGGPAATMEPLKDNLSDYIRHMQNCFGYGVQACYRGPRLFDSHETKSAVVKWVNWFKAHREILESDIVHLRRADGQRLDYVLHVNPQLKTKALLAIYNPLTKSITETLEVPLYYSGLRKAANVMTDGVTKSKVSLDSNQKTSLKVTVPAEGFTWITFE